MLAVARLARRSASPPAATTTTSGVGSGSADVLRRGGDVSGSDRDRRLLDGLPVRPGGGRAVQRGEPRREDHRRPSGTGGGFEKFCAGETDISTPRARSRRTRRSRSARRAASSTPRSQVANDGIAVATNKDLAVDCMTTEQLKELWNKGSKVTSAQRDRPELPGHRALALRPGHGLRHVRLLHRRDQRRGGRDAARTTRPPRTTTSSSPASSGDEGGFGYFGFSYYEAAGGQAEPGRRRQRRRQLRQAERRDDPGRLLQAALAPAVHVPEREGGRRGRRSRRSSTSPSRTRRRSPRRPRSSRSPRSRSARPRKSSRPPRAARGRNDQRG